MRKQGKNADRASKTHWAPDEAMLIRLRNTGGVQLKLVAHFLRVLRACPGEQPSGRGLRRLELACLQYCTRDGVNKKYS